MGNIGSNILLKAIGIIPIIVLLLVMLKLSKPPLAPQTVIMVGTHGRTQKCNERKIVRKKYKLQIL